MQVTKETLSGERARAALYLQEGRFEEALDVYQKIISTNKTELVDEEIAINYGFILRKLGLNELAASHYGTWTSIYGKSEILALNACNFFREIGDSKTAVKIIDKYIACGAFSTHVLLSKVECLIDLRRIDEAGAIMRVLDQSVLKTKRALIASAIIAARQGMVTDGLSFFEEAQRLDPTDVNITFNLITLLADMGRVEAARQIYNTLDGKKKQLAAAKGCLSNLLLREGDYIEASICIEELCRLNPSDEGRWLNWASSLRGLKYTIRPISILKRALLYNPKSFDLIEALAQGYAETCRPECMQRAYALQEEIKVDKIKDVNLFNRLFLSLYGHLFSAEMSAKAAREWEQRRAAPYGSLLHMDYLREPLERRKIRIGYLTSDACSHPVGRFLLPILCKHNRDLLETTIVSCGNKHDAISEKLRYNTDHWLDCSTLSDLESARIIADHRLDILIELGGFTGGSRIGILTHRPAAIQLSYLGYPGPTYLRSIDGWIGDQCLFGALEEVEATAHKKLLIDGGYMVYKPEIIVDICQGAERQEVIFGCYNHSRKLTKEAVELFVGVLNKCVNSKIALKSISFHELEEQERVKHLFLGYGISSERILINSWSESHRHHLMMYQEIDIALDPIPYGGATTTCEALWMGVPVVALAGPHMVGRLSASILQSANCEEWIAGDKNQYTQIAERLYRQGPRLWRQRLTLREKIKASDLCNAKRVSRSLECIYKGLTEEKAIAASI